MLRIYRLSFQRAHFGEGTLDSAALGFFADRLFSALCHEIIQVGGKAAYERFLDLCKNSQFALSDAMPYIEKVVNGVDSSQNGQAQSVSPIQYFLPKPFVKLPKKESLGDEEGRKLAKSAKKLKHIEVEKFIDFVNGRADLVGLSKSADFGQEVADAKNQISRIGKDTKPYSVGVFSYGQTSDEKQGTEQSVKKRVGLYIITDFDNGFEHVLSDVLKGVSVQESGGQSGVLESSSFRTLLTALGLSGIGGKRSSGLGKFKVEAEVTASDALGQQWLSSVVSGRDAVQSESGDSLMLLTTAAPNNTELENAGGENLLKDATFLLEKKSGFICSQNGGEMLRKRDVYKFKAGSCFSRAFSGEISDVRPRDYPHRVDSFSKPLFFKFKAEVGGEA
ncbi:MAG: hypothetical protein LBQ41_03275 [Candidatus Ancillula sp.]|jgi:CRISPR-associated protein Csm4|nr:hypothetical protein [Candidatus Ancillula sp.]